LDREDGVSSLATARYQAMSSSSASVEFWPGHLAGSGAPAPPRPVFKLCRVEPVHEWRSDDLEHERLLCERAKAGDREALGTLLGRHGPRLYRSVLLPRLGSTALAEEALSTTYVRVVERFAQFTWQAVGVYPWLRMVALRVALDQLRAQKRELLFEPADIERELEARDGNQRAAEALEEHDLLVARRKVESVLGRINERYALAIRLRVLDERSREEAAGVLGVTVATFDVVLHRALAALRKVLSTASGELS
jgi:RNA polymerase sigma-70 factor (ECF subfamily)